MLTIGVSFLVGCTLLYYIKKHKHDVKKVLILCVICIVVFSYALSKNATLIRKLSHKEVILKKNQESIDKNCQEKSGKTGIHYDFHLDDLLVACKLSFQSKKLYYDITTENFSDDLDLVRSNYEKLWIQ